MPIRSINRVFVLLFLIPSLSFAGDGFSVGKLLDEAKATVNSTVKGLQRLKTSAENALSGHFKNKSLDHTYSGLSCQPSFENVHYLGMRELTLSPRTAGDRPDKICSGFSDCGGYAVMIDPNDKAWGGSAYERLWITKKIREYGGAVGQAATDIGSEKTFYCSSHSSDDQPAQCESIPRKVNFGLPAGFRTTTQFQDGQCMIEVVYEGPGKTVRSGRIAATREIRSQVTAAADNVRRQVDGEFGCLAGLAVIEGRRECKCPNGNGTPVTNDEAGVRSCGEQPAGQCIQGLVAAGGAQPNRPVDSTQPGAAGGCKCPTSQYLTNPPVVPNEPASLARCQSEEETARVAAENAEADARISAYHSCVDEIGRNFETECGSAATGAINACNGRQNVSPAEQAGIASVNTLKNQFIASKAGTGMMQDCFVAGAVARTSQEFMKPRKTGCDASVETCKSTCQVDVITTRSASCVEKLDQPTASGKSIRDGSSAAGRLQSARSDNYVAGRVASARTNVANDKNRCENQASEMAQGIATAISGLGQSVNQAATCMCQLSNSGMDCKNLPDQFACSGVTGDPRCSYYQGFGACAAGNGIANDQLCRCISNPQGPGCNTGSGLAMNSIFSGEGLKNMGTGVSNFGGGGIATGGNSPKAGNLNFNSSGGGGSEQSAANLRQGDLSGGTGGPTRMGTTGGGGGGGFGGGNGNLADPNAAAAGGDPNAGANGKNNAAFNKALTTTGGNTAGFRGKSGAVVAGDPDKLPKVGDPANFKPKGKLRGLAGFDEDAMFVIGKKNMDIFKMMSLCTSGESCKSNVNGYITDP